jgi:hypothetical protein
MINNDPSRYHALDTITRITTDISAVPFVIDHAEPPDFGHL